LIGLTLGVSMAAPPGPVMTVIMKKSLSSIKSGFLVGMGAMTADLILLFLVLLLKNYVDLTAYEPIIFILGGLYFVYLALKILNEVINTNRMKESESNTDFSYFKGLFTGILNPMQIGWWLTAGLSIIEADGISPFYFFYLGIIVYVYLLCFVIYKTHAKYQEKVSFVVNIFSIFVLLVFGSYFIFSFLVMDGLHF
jgi:L-lysine exporter family protein LysE/ArgO